MLKTLTKNDTTTTPYVATKNWNLSNVANDDLVLSEAGNLIAAENVDYFPTFTSPNYECNVAKENQSLDLARYREGLKTTGLFYPDIDLQNLDGTYKRMVYQQIKTMFYNNYRDPTKIWGTEKIDFDSSQTKKFLSDAIKLFDIPTNILGQKITEGSVSIIDNTLDDDYLITDDGNCNLFAGINLFSKQQELGYFTNNFQTGSDNTCNSYVTLNVPKNPYALTASQVNLTETASLQWLDDPAEGFVIERSINDSGSSFSFLTMTSAGITSSLDTTVLYGNTYWYRVYAFNRWGSSSYTNTASVNIITSSFTASYTLQLTIGNDSGEFTLGDGADTEQVGGSFTTTGSFNLKRLSVGLSSAGNPIMKIGASIWSDKGGSNTIPLIQVSISSTVLDSTTLGPSFTEIPFDFSTPVSLLSSTRYWVVLSASFIDNTNYVLWGAQTASQNENFATGGVPPFANVNSFCAVDLKLYS